MLNTYKLNEHVYLSTDKKEIALFEQNDLGTWDVFSPLLNKYIANDLDTFDEAEGTAFQYLSMVSA
jgi:hypothetical protein